MAHFAKLDDNNVVLEVNVVNNAELIVEKVVVNEGGYINVVTTESEEKGIDFLTEWSGGHTNWRQTSYNGSFRGKYAGIGDTYENGVFVAPVVEASVEEVAQVTSEVSTLSSTDIPALSSADVAPLTSADIPALTTSDLSVMTTSDISSLG